MRDHRKKTIEKYKLVYDDNAWKTLFGEIYFVVWGKCPDNIYNYDFMIFF